MSFKNFGYGGSITSSGTQNQPLIFFIHGFMSSGESFHSFPLDLTSYLNDRHQLKVDVDLYNYDTRGSNTTRVRHLVWHMAQKCSGSNKRPWIALFAHSMGGLLAVDAARCIESINKGLGWGFPPASADTPASPRGFDEPLDWNSLATVNSIKSANVKIKLIVAFDSPYYGLHPRVFTGAGAGRVLDIGSSLTTWRSAAGREPGRGATSTSNMAMSSTVEEQTVATTSLSVAGSRGLGGTSAHTTTTTTRTTTSWGWGVLGAVALAGAAALASSPTARDLTGRLLQVGQQVVSDHAEFLGPLWQIADMDVRMGAVERMDMECKTLFKCFYIQIKKSAPPSSNVDACTSTTLQFIASPPPNYTSRYFIPIRSNGHDEIEGHQRMFDVSKNPESYPVMLEQAADFVLTASRM
ncbi:hypothetical protein SeMB42_g02562 [Synchytrium endobioticum]|uniref:AB hydrolase-1 domain-containing protein n=1 Tax=Synchytrium endobioticum TaxID=286115 RepID=A0A507DEG7_9FUNG|nr:hypothetical protein SeLEV6574_g01579 [Synchytrium endobioticum]TPX49594.1 hypothetical protein SeMB42_g02562 [Synchytrium endobioticum]